jgi:hypothetical protein
MFVRSEKARVIALLVSPFALGCGARSHLSTKRDGGANVGGTSAGESPGGAQAGNAGGGVAGSFGTGGSPGVGGLSSGAGGGGTAGESDAGSDPIEHSFIAVPDRVDVVHDAKRARVYISTSRGTLERYDLENDTMLEPIELGVTLKGMDLSPDGDTLAVADGQLERSPRRSVLHLVTLTDQSSEKVLVSVMEGAGFHSVVFVGPRAVLATSDCIGTCNPPMVRIDLDTGSVEAEAEVSNNTMLVRSADDTMVAYAESNHSGGPCGFHPIADGGFREIYSGTFLHDLALDRFGDRIALPTWQGLKIYDWDFNLTRLPEPYESKGVVGAVFSPTLDRIYVAWSGTGIEAFDTNSWERAGMIDPDPSFELRNHWAYQTGRMRMSRDGSLLLVTVTDGVNVYSLGG